jgi:serine/threonine-protein kinase PknG
LNYCHSKSIIYCDVKPDNILFDGENVTLIDFGHAVQPDENCEVHFLGTYEYNAPEVNNDHEHSYARDVWALGVTLLGLVRHLHIQ